MARKAEAGIEYFPMNADIIQNPKIRLVVAEFGSKTTWAVLLPLYCKIYREKGYWIDWLDEDSKLLFAQDECKIELTVMNEFVNGCIRRSLFNKRVFDLFGVLTSDRIQENYLIAKKRNKEVEFIDEFKLIPDNVYNEFKNVNIINLNVNIIKKNVNIGTQKKKENKIIEEDGDYGKPPKHTPNEILFFKNFQDFIKNDAANVGKMKEPFTIEEYLKLKEKFTSQQIKLLIEKMGNNKPLLSKNISAYRTFLNWMARDYNTEAPKNEITNGISINDRLKAATQNRA